MRHGSLHSWALPITLILLITAVRTLPTVHYQHWAPDEQVVVGLSVGFLDYDFNPGWFDNHPLPMYVLSALYFVIYGVQSVLGLVSSKVEFASQLYGNDAIFFMSARPLFSLAYTIGCFVLASLLWRRWQSRLGAVVFFGVAIFLPDAVRAANRVRVETFVFLFLSLTVYFSCFAPKSRQSFILATACCAAAFASKSPAVTLFPVLFLKLVFDVRDGAYPRQTLLHFVLLAPLLSILFMPYLLLDLEATLSSLGNLQERVSGNQHFSFRLGSYRAEGTVEKLRRLLGMLRHNSSCVFLFGSAGLGLWAALRERTLLFPLLFVAAYVAAFSSSATIDRWWFRPVFPFLVFFTVLLVLRLSALAPRARTPALLALAAYFCLFANQGIRDYLERLEASPVDERIAASRWIQDELPAGSTVVLDGAGTYMPIVFSNDRWVTRHQFGYLPKTEKNDFLGAAFNHYYDRHAPRAKTFDVVLKRMKENRYSPEETVLPMDSYVVISKRSYHRFHADYMMWQLPEITRNARAYYASIRERQQVYESGPLSIHRIPANVKPR